MVLVGVNRVYSIESNRVRERDQFEKGVDELGIEETILTL